MATCKPPPHELDAFEACAALSDRRRLAPSGGGKPGESPGGGKPGEYDSPYDSPEYEDDDEKDSCGPPAAREGRVVHEPRR